MRNQGNTYPRIQSFPTLSASIQAIRLLNRVNGLQARILQQQCQYTPYRLEIFELTTHYCRRIHLMHIGQGVRNSLEAIDTGLAFLLPGGMLRLCPAPCAAARWLPGSCAPLYSAIPRAHDNPGRWHVHRYGLSNEWSPCIPGRHCPASRDRRCRRFRYRSSPWPG